MDVERLRVKAEEDEQMRENLPTVTSPIIQCFHRLKQLPPDTSLFLRSNLKYNDIIKLIRYHKKGYMCCQPLETSVERCCHL